MGRWEWGSLSEECRVQSEEQPSGRRFHSEASALADGFLCRDTDYG
ncbi:hypothetical protein I3500192B8_14860 [Acidaminococcus intestini]